MSVVCCLRATQKHVLFVCLFVGKVTVGMAMADAKKLYSEAAEQVHNDRMGIKRIHKNACPYPMDCNL